MKVQKINHFCNQCKKEKPKLEFSTTEFNKRYSRCKFCVSEYNKIYRSKNKEKYCKYKKEYYKNNIDKVKEKHQIYKKNNFDKIAQYKRDYFLENKDKINEYLRGYTKNRKNNDIIFNLRTRLSKYIGIGLKKRNLSKNGNSIMKILPYSIIELKIHLESQFESWMTWDNYGIYKKDNWNDSDSNTWKWNIDHIIPQSTFKYTSMEDEAFQKCWALDNLRPYSAKQNLLDGNR